MLERGAEQDALIPCDHVLGTVAVVDIKVDYGNPLQAPMFQRVQGGHGDRAEQAEAHGALPLGVVPRRTHSTEGRAGLPAH